MTRLGSGGDVGLTVGTTYIGKGVKQARAGIKTLGSTFDKMGAQVSKTTRSIFSFRNALIGTGLTLALGRISKSVIATTAEFEGFRVQLESITGSARKARAMFDKTLVFAAKTPFEVDELVQVRALLESVGVTGLESLRGVGNAAAAMNRNITDTGAALLSMEKEVLQRYGIVLNRTATEGTFIWRDAEGRRKEITVKNNDEILRSTLIAIWNERYAGAMERFSSSWKGMTSNLADEWTQMKALIGEAGVFDFLKAGMALTLEEIDRLKEEGKLDEWAQETSDRVIDVFESTAIGAAALADSMTPIIRGISNEASFIWDQFQSLPIWAKQFGVVGVLLGGKKGAFVAFAMLHLMGAAKNIAIGFQEVLKGNLELEELAFMNAKELAEWVEKNKAEDNTIAGLLEPPDPESFEAKIQGIIDRIKQKRAEMDAERKALLAGEGGAAAGAEGGLGGGGGFDAEQAALEGRFRAQEEWTDMVLDLKIKEEQELAKRNKNIIGAEQARANIVGVAYQAMQDQMLSLIETGRFSVGEFAKVIAQQVKLELTGIASRSAVWAVFETAMGLAAAAVGNVASATKHFASAKTFAMTAGAALAGAAATHALFGGTASRPAPGTIGGEPIRTTPAGTTTPVPPLQTPEPQRPQIIFQVENMQLLDENSVDLLMERISERVEDYDVELRATKVTT